MSTNKEECVGEKRVCKDCPPSPSSRSLAQIQHLGYNQSNNDPYKFITRVCYQIQELTIVRDAQDVRPHFQYHNLQYYDHERVRE